MARKINSEQTVDNDSFKLKVGTTDKKNPKTIYIDCGFFIEPKEEKIVVRPISFLRGASFENCFICVSEAEEFTKEELFLIISRFENGKMVISGDPLQASRNQVRNGNSGLLHAMEKLTDINGVGTVKFTEDDIVRNDILYDIYKKWNS